VKYGNGYRYRVDKIGRCRSMEEYLMEFVEMYIESNYDGFAMDWKTGLEVDHVQIQYFSPISDTKY